MFDRREIMACMESLRILQIDLTEINLDTIKKAYRNLCRQYHPDQFSKVSVEIQNDMRQRYIQVQNAYHTLLKYGIENIRQYVAEYNLYNRMLQQERKVIPVQRPVMREAKVFASNKEAIRLNKLQTAYREDKKKDSVAFKKRTVSKESAKQPADQMYEETLRKIGAIWIAEVIHKQIQEDQKKKDRENREKLYKAFMQYNQNQHFEKD